MRNSNSTLAMMQINKFHYHMWTVINQACVGKCKGDSRYTVNDIKTCCCYTTILIDLWYHTLFIRNLLIVSTTGL